MIGNDIYMLLLNILPVLMYSFILWGTFPINSINWRDSWKFLLMGVLSNTFVILFQLAIPSFYKPMSLPFIFFDPCVDKIFTNNFIQTGLIEEMFKLICFFMMFKPRTQYETIFFFCLVSAGFGMTENIYYSHNIPSSDTPLIRAFSAILLHMSTGIIQGYWISKTLINKFDRSFFGILMRNQKGKVIFYSLIGLMCAAFLHGLYDFNISIGGDSYPTLLFLTLSIPLTIAYFSVKSIKN